MVALLGTLAACAGCSKHEGKAAGAPAGPIGKVSAVAGPVTAARAGAPPRTLAVNDAVYGDDTITTGAAASVTLELARGGHWELGAERSRALAEVVAELASLGGAEARGQDVTAAAGRHAEAEAADTAGTTKGAPPQLPGPVDNAPGGLGLTGVGAGGGGRGDGIGLGNLGAVGRGGGGGKSYGTSLGPIGGHKGPVAVVVEGTASVEGRLDPSVIQRVIRVHRGEARYCYEKQLLQNPKLAGRVSVTFVIGRDGNVMSAVVQSSTVDDPEVGTCLTGRVKAWMFPKPDSVVQVTYPFVFKTGG